MLATSILMPAIQLPLMGETNLLNPVELEAVYSRVRATVAV